MMLRSLEVKLRCYDDTEFAQLVAELAEAQTLINMWQLERDGDALPCCLGCGGVQYEPPQPCGPVQACPSVRDYPCQSLLDARGIYMSKRGTCLDLACERAARLRLKGLEATVVVVFRYHAGRRLPGQYHAYVETPNGPQDPSYELQHNPGQCAGPGTCDCTGHP